MASNLRTASRFRATVGICRTRKAPAFSPITAWCADQKFTQIPYRALLPVGIPNLIAVGRCIGVEREALGVVRVMGPCLAMGECAGVAAGLAVAADLPFDAVDVTALRQKICDHGGMVDRAQVKALLS